MGIGGVTSLNRMTVMQTPATNAPDAKSKKIQNEITDAERKLQKLSSDVELSYAEKTDEQKTLKKEISGLNTKLEQRQEELVQAQKKESLLAELREQDKPKQPGTVIASSSDGVVVLKEETAQAENDSAPTENNAAMESEAAETEEENSALAKTGAIETEKENIAAENTKATEEAKSVEETKVTEKAKAMEETKAIEETKVAKETKTTEEEKSVEETKATEEEKSTEEPKPTDTDTDTSLSPNEMRAMVSADASAQQANRQGTIISKTEDGIAVLKGEIAQDERRGIDTERKQAELEKMEKQAEQATTFQFSVLGNAMNAGKAAVSGTEKAAQDNTENNAYTTALRATQEEQAAQRFQVSIA